MQDRCGRPALTLGGIRWLFACMVLCAYEMSLAIVIVSSVQE